MNNSQLREYFINKEMPSHYPKWLNGALTGWAALHTEEEIRIYDIFKLKSGKRVLVNEIRRIERHAIGFIIWEFVDRDTGDVFHFNDIETKQSED